MCNANLEMQIELRNQKESTRRLSNLNMAQAYKIERLQNELDEAKEELKEKNKIIEMYKRR